MLQRENYSARVSLRARLLIWNGIHQEWNSSGMGNGMGNEIRNGNTTITIVVVYLR